MNILFFTHYSSLYGANLSLLTLLKGLKERGHTCYVVVPSTGAFSLELDKLNISYFIEDYLWWVFENKSGGSKISIKQRFSYIFKLIRNNRFKVIKLKKKVSRLKIDLVYSNSSVILLGLIFSFFIKKPHVWHLRELITLHYNYIPVVGFYFFRFILKRSTACICISNVAKNYYFGNNKLKNTHVIYNGVISENLINISIKSADSKNIVLSIIGVIAFDKKQEEAIEAISLLHHKYHNIQLQIVGSGNIEKLVSLVSDLDLKDKVRFLGYKSDIGDVYRESFAILVCSRNEAMGRVTAEAMAYGVPVIGQNSGGTKELIQHEVTGLLYNNKSSELAECIERIINDKVLYDRISYSSRSFAKKFFTKESYILSVENVFLNSIYSNR